MKVIPKEGMDDLPFGIPIEELLQRLGPPATDQLMDDVDTHPKSRRVLNYVNRGFLVTPERGIVSIEVEAEQSNIELWDTSINEMSPDEFAEFLTTKGCDTTVSKPDGWGDQTVEALSHGIIRSFCEGSLESVEVHDPSWREPN